MGARADGLRESEVLPESEELLGLAGRVADRESVDWEAELARETAPAERPYLQALRAIDKLGAISSGLEGELPAPFSPAPERRWGALEIVGLLGRGSYGSVHVARDPQLDRLVALKLFRRADSSASGREAALREGRLLARLKHPNIATVYGFDERDGELGLWMELVRGRTLAARVAEDGPLGALEAALAGVEVCRALAAVHAAGILHRDVKAQNVIREEGGRLVLVDFGLGLEDAAAESARPGGTPLYLAPEVVGGQAPSVRSDLYAVGVLLYHLASGGFPVEAQDLGELVDRHARGERRPLRDRRPDLPQAFVDLVERATAVDPQARFGSAGEMERDLLTVVAGEDGRSSAARRALHRSGWLLVSLATAAIAGIASLLWFANERDAPVSAAELVPRRLTSSAAAESEPAISPDGTLVAYVSSEAGAEDLWLVDTRGGRPLRLTDDSGADRWPCWLPDGSGILFESDRGGSPAIWKVDRLGGTPSFVVGGASQPAVSPDGKRVAFAAIGEGGLTRIAVAAVDSPSTIRVLTGSEIGFWSHRSPAWSPDGRWIAFEDLGSLWLTDESGAVRPVVEDGEGAESPSWSADGRWLYYGSSRGGTRAIWRASIATGALERVTLGSAAEGHPRLSLDGARLSYATFDDRVELSVADLATGEILAELRTSGSEQFPAFSPDGTELVYVTTRRGSVQLWKAGLEGGRIVGTPVPLVANGGAITHPTFSPDGRYVAFQERRGAQRDILAVPAAGGPVTPVVATPAIELLPAWSPLGDELTFVRKVGSRYELYRQPMRGAQPIAEPIAVPLPDFSPLTQAWSPDGRQLAVVGVDDAGSSDAWIVDVVGTRAPRRLTDGREVLRARWLDPGRLAIAARWDARGYTLRFLELHRGAISEPPAPILFGSTARGRYHFDLSSRRDRIAYSHGERSGDVWILEGTAGRF